MRFSVGKVMLLTTVYAVCLTMMMINAETLFSDQNNIGV